ncbi:Xaa-Pro peptidase family protein [Paenibacillus sp. sptzw28]|uniref:M24 family metallopeptidase n=1 Tax=Paenibacillus sp. sptzw28 TaxID=715179 RepID=UPI001C6DF719|nr:Xaa-Pro peptidase family protein [Paenibacillus sp. sptzw28]QYR19506.1 Xaa-Pro peptidase family protein [Paenibacillus sp. sptzw28]
MNDRILKLGDYMEQTLLDAILITFPLHVYYLTGYRSDPHERFLGLVLQRGDEPFMLVPELDLEAAQASSSVKRIFTHGDTEDSYEILKGLAGGAIKRLGIEKGCMSVHSYERLAGSVKAHEYVSVDQAMREMRAVKTPDEMVLIRQTVRMVEDVLSAVVAKVKPGMTEIEIAAELEYAMRKSGAEGPAFATTVLSGEKSAMPHGTTGTRKVGRGELLLFDLGVYAGGYMSDITRTFAVGDISDSLKTVYDTVLQANLRGIEAVRPGVRMSDVDQAARRYIEDQGYGAYFTHRLGHGLGLEIHEYPSVHGKNTDVLREGMVMTIEPGIYLTGIGGVRIEDDIAVTSTGVEVLTAYPKELTVIGE